VTPPPAGHSPVLVVAEEPKGDTQVNVPVILAELGFMTNPTEDRLLGTHRPTNAVRLLDSAAGPLLPRALEDAVRMKPRYPA